MNDFIASNGVQVRQVETSIGTRLAVKDSDPAQAPGYPKAISVESWLDPRQADAIREFFRAHEGERLGLWRSKADPAWTAIVQDGSGYIYFRHEDGEHGFSIAPDGGNLAAWSYELQKIAREYLDTHPATPAWASAMVITWDDGAYLAQIAQRDPQTNGGMDKGWWTGEGQDGRWLSTEKLAALIGDAEVTVLVPESV